jgi:hypothetical protein
VVVVDVKIALLKENERKIGKILRVREFFGRAERKNRKILRDFQDP